MSQLISFDIYADFGFLKKPDTNEPMYLTFNMIHKPFVLGLLGAILGEKGFEENNVLPEYYKELKNIKIGIEPIDSENGNFQKTVIKYNNSTGTANATSIENIKGKIGTTLNIVEQTLINPSYRIYLLTDNQELLARIENQEAVYLPYLGKNDFSLWWKKESVKKYDYKEFIPIESYKVCTLFAKKMILREGKEEEEESPTWEMNFLGNEFMYFERLPIGYDDVLYQYIYRPFVYTTFKLKKNYKIDDLYQLDNGNIIQLF